jgi:hypothetical protein
MTTTMPATFGQPQASIQFSAMEETEVSWLWQGVIMYGGVSLIVGPGGVGKKMLMADIAARVSNGWPMPPHDKDNPVSPRETPGQVIMISLEDDGPGMIKPVLKAAGADQSMIFDLSRPKRPKGSTERARFSIPADLGLLRSEIERLGNVRMVIIDPLMSAATTTVSFNQQARLKIMDPLEEIASDYGIALPVVHHFVKGRITAENIYDKIGGSSGLRDAVRTCTGVVAVGDVRCLVNLKDNNAGAVEAPRYRIMGDAPYGFVEWAQPVPNVADGTSAQLREHVMSYLVAAEQPVTAQQLTIYTRLSYGIVNQILTAERRRGNVQRVNNAYQILAIGS